MNPSRKTVLLLTGLLLIYTMILSGCTPAETGSPMSQPMDSHTPAATATLKPTATIKPRQVTPIPTSTKRPTLTATSEVEIIIYTIQSGDTLGAIAAQFDVSVDQIAAANDIADPGKIRTGQELSIPQSADPSQASSAYTTENTPPETTQDEEEWEIVVDDSESLCHQIRTELGESNRGFSSSDRAKCIVIDGDIQVSFHVNDSFFLEETARGEVMDILLAIQGASIPFETVNVIGYFPLSGEDGTRETMVLNLRYSKNIVEKVAFVSPEGYGVSNIFEVADSGNVHPDFENQ